MRGDAACVNEPLQQRVRAVRPRSDFGERKHPELDLREGARGNAELEQPAQQLFVVRFGRNPPGHGRFGTAGFIDFRAGVGNDWRRFGFFPEPADEAEQVPPAEFACGHRHKIAHIATAGNGRMQSSATDRKLLNDKTG